MSVQSATTTNVDTAPRTASVMALPTRTSSDESRLNAATFVASVHRLAGVSCGSVLGTVERRFGTFTRRESVAVRTVLERCADLAVADRVAYLSAVATLGQTAVVCADGWYYVVQLDTELAIEQFARLRAAPDAPRVLGVATSAGVVPQLGA